MLESVREALKKSLLASLGAIDFSVEKAGEAVDMLVERGELSAEQGKNVLGELIERGRAQSGELSERIDDVIEKALGKVTFVTSAKWAELEARVAKLEGKQKS